MKRLSILSILSLCLLSSALADDTVAPQTLSGVALYRDVVTINYSTNVHYTQGASLRMTNMQCYSTAKHVAG